MQVSIIRFPGSNRDRDMIAAVKKLSGKDPTVVWHGETSLPKSDLIILPGGFSYGDYLRAGAIAARSPIVEEVRNAAGKGAHVLGVCNGFQILTESGLLPGGLMRNASLKFVCKTVELKVENNKTAFTNLYAKGEVLPCPVAHHDGNYFGDETTIKQLQDDDRIAFTYANGTNPNGSMLDIAGILNAKGNVLGMMPHPENLIEPAHGGEEGARLFKSIFEGAFA